MPGSGTAPIVPHPNTSFVVEAVCAQSGRQSMAVQSVAVPVAQTPQPELLMRVAKNAEGASFAPAQPSGELAATSAGPAQTCHPAAQKSATPQVPPVGKGPSSPPCPSHVVGAGWTMPGRVQPPEQPAMRG